MKRKKRRSLAVITGASSGIGKEFAHQLALEGYDLVLVARRKDKLEELSKDLELMYKVKVQILCADLSRELECAKLVDFLSDKKVGIFINNAGFGDCGYFADTDLIKEMSMVDVNIKAVHILTKRMINKMTVQGYGYILNVGSSAGLLPAGPYMATYYASKAYVVSFTRAVAAELKEHNNPVYVGCLCPGPVDTEFNDVANVSFSLNGISPMDCVSEAIRQMKKRRVVIVPTLTMQIGTVLGRLLPQDVLIGFVGSQQKKKLGK